MREDSFLYQGFPSNGNGGTVKAVDTSATSKEQDIKYFKNPRQNGLCFAVALTRIWQL